MLACLHTPDVVGPQHPTEEQGAGLTADLGLTKTELLHVIFKSILVDGLSFDSRAGVISRLRRQIEQRRYFSRVCDTQPNKREDA